MSYDLNEINRRVTHEPEAFIAECDARYNTNVDRAARKILENLGSSQIVLLSGPSGSGKTTTAYNIERRLKEFGVESYTVSLDDYYTDVDPLTAPRNKQGEFDFESPELLDLPLLRAHFGALDAGKEIVVPHYDFDARRRDRSAGRPLRLKKNEIALFEGIHALGDEIANVGAGKAAAKVYISARSNIEAEGEIVFRGTWIRILRRVIRDMKFRGTPAVNTFAMWENLRVGEKKYISPYKNTADVIFDSSFAYEVSALKNFADGIFDGLPQNMPRRAEALRLRDALELFAPLDEKYIPQSSLIREFIG